MNKKTVNTWIERAVRALSDSGIAREGTIERGFRGQISSFGSAIVMGNLKAAVAFYTKQEKADVNRTELLKAIYYVINDLQSSDELANVNGYTVFRYVCEAKDQRKVREDFINASIALKLAMNFYDLKDSGSC